MRDIIENFKFLVVEAENQVKLTYGLISDFSEDLLEKIASKDDYIDNLKTTVENKCFSKIHSSKHPDTKEVNAIRSIHIMCLNLERIADYCVNIARQLHYLSEISFIHQYDYRGMFSEIQKALAKITPVFAEADLSGALDICRAEYQLDKLYKDNFDWLMTELRQGHHIENLITVIFIFRYLERIGDSLLNIGEALIFAIIGDRIKIRQFEALQKTLSESGFDGTLSDIDFTSIWGSRSGCRISKVGNKNPAGFKAQGIFKEGAIKKIKLEQENIRHWNDIFPGLAPKIFGYYEKEETASLLVEFLPGCTLDQIVLTEGDEIIRNVLFIFEQTMNEIWETTRREGTFPTDYMRQLRSRTEAIRRVHPNFYRAEKRIESLTIPSSETLITSCAEIEKQVPAPFTIFIHGDFNVNNIVYNHEEQKINYIDLYRSKPADYIQDASVFLVSNFRLPVFEPRLRERLNRMIQHFFEVFSHFARQHNDHTFNIRMALALARSFYTSTRFELNYSFAREMFLRSHFLLERIATYHGTWEEFELPTEILFY
jgi:phosphate uptake regulator